MRLFFKRGISFALVLIFAMSFYSPSLAVCSDAPFSNGGDSVFINGIEYFINADDCDFLYCDGGLVLSEHVISLTAENGIIYLTSYSDGISRLLAYDTDKNAAEELAVFDTVVSSIAMQGGTVFYVKDGDIESYDTVSEETEILTSDGSISVVYFTAAGTLNYCCAGGIRTLNKSRLSPAFSSDEKENEFFYTPRLTAPDKNDPYYTSLNPLHRGGYGMVDNGGNCTCYAYGRAYEILGHDPKLCTRSAGKWYAYNKSSGQYEYGSVPALGAVAVWTKSGADGHVAVVEVIDGDTVITSESGWQCYYFRTKARSASSYNFSASSSYDFEGFIYVVGRAFSSDIAIKYASIALPSTITQGSAFPLGGTISSSGSKLKKISATISDESGAVCLDIQVDPDSYAYNLKNSELDRAVTFGILDAGTYKFVYRATTESGKEEARIHTFNVEAEKIAGDVNGDSKVNSKDLSLLQRMLSGEALSYCETAFDIDGNGNIDSRDISSLQRLIRG